MPVFTGKTRIEVAACLAASEGADAKLISSFGPAHEETQLFQEIEHISSIPQEDREAYIKERLSAFSCNEGFLGLSDVHPAWLVDVLSAESPRIVGIILRYLPSRQVRYIIEHLPKRIKAKLPQLIDSFAVPAPVLQVIRESFERQFDNCQRPRDLDGFEFENIADIKMDDLMTLFRDIGIHELALALKGADRRSLHILFNRLTIDDARSLQQRIRSLTDVNPSLLKDAKYTLLEMSVQESDPENLLIDLGLNAFAKSLNADDAEIYGLLKQKLEPRFAYTLKRYIDEHRNSNFVDISSARKAIILKRVEALSSKGRIDPGLVRHFVSTEETVIISNDDAPKGEGNTAIKKNEHENASEGWQA